MKDRRPAILDTGPDARSLLDDRYPLFSRAQQGPISSRLSLSKNGIPAKFTPGISLMTRRKRGDEIGQQRALNNWNRENTALQVIYPTMFSLLSDHLRSPFGIAMMRAYIVGRRNRRPMPSG